MWIDTVWHYLLSLLEMYLLLQLAADSLSKLWYWPGGKKVVQHFDFQ